MNTQFLKLELIQWILSLKDSEVLNEIQKMKENYDENAPAVQPRQFGCGKGIFTYSGSRSYEVQ
ncbi:hypothetical protein [Argonema antarcticum]|uniref:hypothetical protein n=1 Tax=Argonema antarcticum TaxID=2942763 RepID=UPI0020116A22|nr:hypothetical protein [Argonema antarcticum]MCL1473185.1 hypothetical protein [Argonema antarcticum A004/B2]